MLAYLALPQDLALTNLLRSRSSSQPLNPNTLQRFLPGKPGELRQLLLEQGRESSPGDLIFLDLLELVYLAQDPTLRPLYQGRQVSLRGQWLAEDAEHFKIARLLIFCCAADGRSISLRVHGTTHPLEDGTWIEIRGTLNLEDSPHPILELDRYEVVESPIDAFL
ncbi:MAG: hypothetical protein HC904_02220 [Blastochloris sp.]|nr:hypothetical protein [Blastochloris sp.]